MKTFLFPLAVLASSAMAQTTSACAANYIVDACLSSERAKLASCKTEEWECLCAGWQNILTCYNNCPNDPRLHESAGQRDIFCGYASQFATTTTKAPPQASTSTPAQATENAEADDSTGTDDDSSSATTSGNGPASTNNAADLVLNAGGVLAAVAGVVAAVL